jgi:hypothetical protein
MFGLAALLARRRSNSRISNRPRSDRVACGRTKELLLIRATAFASLKAPLQWVQGPADPTDDSEEREAAGR